MLLIGRYVNSKLAARRPAGVQGLRTERTPAQGWGSPCGNDWKGANQTSRSRHVITGASRAPPAYPNTTQPKRPYANITAIPAIMIEAITLAALSPLMMACSFVSMIIRPIKKWPHKRGAAICKSSSSFAATQLQRGRVAPYSTAFCANALSSGSLIQVSEGG